ncbi:sugar phosphate isomerase/epimerase family protein [Sphingomonas crocodyli]|uniref:Sugar phosphate isomerase/epimerase n=1 Tax=Sphingomonas crocodyli TaxID=1979270 RepID=A0A437LYL0_9SPHN|nr:TIM barrel protein [Sphingomonas crocodyli]RVT90518.1 sugar phosphate isomerase/epimerase [Sphingomonas crocodyli]
MRISISNIAWDPPEDEAVAEVLRAHGVAHIDVAPGKYFPDPTQASDTAVAEVRGAWADRGVTLYGMQSLLFGTQGFNLFGDDGRMLDRLKRIGDLAGRLGISFLTFGSPKNRDRGDLSDAEVEAQATTFFRALGDSYADSGVVLCLEPNPVAYACNFMTTTSETAAMVRLIDHPAVRMQLDVGALALNGEAPEDLIAANADIIGHVHASEPQLVAIGEGGSEHDRAASALRAHRPDKIVTIEMAAIAGPQRDRVDRSIGRTIAAYGDAA